MKKKIIILGAGISGLTLAWKLHQKYRNSIEITIIEAKNKVGGWIQTKKFSNTTILDLGPKGFSSLGNGSYTMQLIKELKLESELISAYKTAKNKYIFSNNKMKKLNIGRIIFQGILPFLFKDLFVSSHSKTDDSLHNFLSRHFSQKFVQNTIAPIITSIKAGSINNLSMKETFPYLWNLEAKYGSIIKGLLQNSFSAMQRLSQFKNYNLFSLKKGLGSLILALKKNTPSSLLLSSPVTSLNLHDQQNISISINNKIITGNLCFYTLPLNLLPSLLSSQYNFIHNYVRYWDVSCMSFYWDSPFINPYKGYGAVIKKESNSQILGIVWNSNIFPQQQTFPQTRISVILSGAPPKKEAYNICFKALQKYLGIFKKPIFFDYLKGKQSVPQQLPNFHVAKKQLLESLPKNFKIVGQNIAGPGINNCIKSAFETVSNLTL